MLRLDVSRGTSEKEQRANAWLIGMTMGIIIAVGNQPHQQCFTFMIPWLESAWEIGMVVSCPFSDRSCGLAEHVQKETLSGFG